MPKYTYVARSERKLQERLAETGNNLCKIATVTGATKSGKTVLTKKVLAGKPVVWIDGGHVKTAKDFWDIAGAQLQVIAEQELSTGKESNSEYGGDFQAGANVLVAQGTAKLGGKVGNKRTSQNRQKTLLNTTWQVVSELRASQRSIIIDDFHYIPRDLQGEITRTLKPLVFDGVPVIYLAIPHRRYDAVKVEREMNGRIELIEVPAWSAAELVEIAQLGFPLLNVKPHFDTSSKLAQEAQGSPHLMQEFCRQICYLSDFTETVEPSRTINATFDYSIVFRKVANELGKSIFEKLARGPRSRTDRKPRTLRSGKTADIYKVVLLAMASLEPSVSTIEYESLRSAIKSVLDDDLPQAHEVSRVLEQMAKVSSLDESSVPVIDYEKDERKLHITDPFFAFFLRWGKEMMN